MNTKQKAAQYSNIWLPEPEVHDFPAAQDYLELIFEPETAAAFVQKLQQAKTIQKKSKDIFRASSLPLLPKNNIHVKENLRKVKNSKKLSPILLVRGNYEKLIIADGYHRLCCSYYLTEDLEVPCRLV
ncbi:hypothetical protein [uncultured Chryseobacterium sp.]|uniref:hypothetical protein n=1 Tax=uncultured Chryseobacterium sp. TaxID=259322 RepID=UPI0025CD2051|nr:hypothetical protein [uncultured Chryseobacterium sp.]